jgi:hypothetical protein
MEKHSSLLKKVVTCSHKKIYNIGFCLTNKDLKRLEGFGTIKKRNYSPILILPTNKFYNFGPEILIGTESLKIWKFNSKFEKKLFIKNFKNCHILFHKFMAILIHIIILSI